MNLNTGTAPESNKLNDFFQTLKGLLVINRLWSLKVIMQCIIIDLLTKNACCVMISLQIT